MSLTGLKQTALWKTLRGVKRALVPPGTAPLSAADFVGSVAFVDPPVAVAAGRPAPWSVRVTNAGGQAWPAAGAHSVGLWAEWSTPHTGRPFGDRHQFPLPAAIYPGEPVELPLPVPTPGFVGDFALTVGLSDGTDRLGPAECRVTVLAPRERDIDYHAVYRTADLAANHWWVVGAYHSRDEYERSIGERFGMLRTLGLTPDSRVLDIGCGTGQIGEALEGFLSDRGAYYGTDIGREAVTFCQTRFKRPNFVFRVGEMTRVPFAAEADGLFDFAVFFSVFTHTYTDESALLLAEAARLLAPGGSVVADVITSPLVERGVGHRGEMVVNRDHFLRLAGMLGLAGEVIGTFPWNPHAERLMIRFRRP
ncbi:MAG: class I SAM-dependent methyltransferase [Gemmataceae bacterium]